MKHVHLTIAKVVNTGVYLLRTQSVMLVLPDFGHKRFDKDLNAHSIIDLMASILEHTNEKGLVLKNTIPLFDDENNNESFSDAMIINNSRIRRQ